MNNIRLMEAYRYSIKVPLPEQQPLYHVAPRGMDTLQLNSPKEICRSFFGEVENIHAYLAIGMIWFHANPGGDIWSQDSERIPLFDEDKKEVYWIPAGSIQDCGARVTNDYYNLW